MGTSQVIEAKRPCGPAEALKAQSDALGLVARVFEREPTGESMAQMGGRLAAIEPWAQERGGKIAKAVDQLRRLIGTATESGELDSVIETLDVEYATLFYGVGADPVFPVESVHRGSEHTLYERPFFEVTDCFKRNGFEGIEGFTEPNDHIANELAFLSFLYGEAAESLGNGEAGLCESKVDAARAFEREHLAAWGGDFAGRVMGIAKTRYFIDAAMLLDGYIEEHLD